MLTHLVQLQLPLYYGRSGSIQSFGVATPAADSLHHLRPGTSTALLYVCVSPHQSYSTVNTGRKYLEPSLGLLFALNRQDQSFASWQREAQLVSLFLALFGDVNDVAQI